MFRNGEEFDVSEAEVFHPGDESIGQLPEDTGFEQPIRRDVGER